MATTPRSPGLNAGHFYSNVVMPVKVDLQFTVAATNGLGITSLKSNGYVRNVFMFTSTTPTANDGYTNPNPAAGYALIQLKRNYNHYLGGFSSLRSPVTGSDIHIASSSVLTAGVAYQITAVGAAVAPVFTITTAADSSGSLAGKYLLFSDQFKNNYALWFSVSGVGSAPSLTGSLTGYTAVQQSIATNDTANTIATALRITIGALNGSNSFTTGGSTSAVTVTGKLTTVNFSPFPIDVSTGFTVSTVTYTTIAAGWNHVGLPPGLTPTIGQSFIATATGSAVISSAATVKAVTVSGITCAEVIGITDTSLNNSNIAADGGAWVLLQFLGATNSSTTTLIPTAPAAGTVVNTSLYFDASSVTVDGL